MEVSLTVGPRVFRFSAAEESDEKACVNVSRSRTSSDLESGVSAIPLRSTRLREADGRFRAVDVLR
jgi:hypothetical protein